MQMVPQMKSNTEQEVCVHSNRGERQNPSSTNDFERKYGCMGNEELILRKKGVSDGWMIKKISYVADDMNI